MLRATGAQGSLALLPGDEGPNTLYRLTEQDLWDLEGQFPSLAAAQQAASERYGVAPEEWAPGEFTIGDVMKAYALDAIQMAHERFQVELDLSEASLQGVETIVGKVYESRPRGLARFFKKGPSDAELQGIAKAFGAYIGEVVRRHHGGEWTDRSAGLPDQQIMTLRIGTLDIYPPAKAYKRLQNGPEDAIPFYYKVMTEQLLKQ